MLEISFATQFYTQINGGQIPTQADSGLLTNSSGAALTAGNDGISNKIMNQLGLQTIYNNGTVNTAVFQGINPWLIGFMGTILFLITAFVMFSLAFILIARFISLIFLIIVAPIGFAGWAIPKLSGISKQWWDKLVQQTITAPILLLMLYIALAIITDTHFLAGFGMTTVTGGAATGFVNNLNLPGFASFILSFIVAMGLLLIVVRYAGTLGAAGASWATKTAGKLTFGATASLMRNTAGRGANMAAKGLRNTRLATVPIIGTGIVKGLDKVATGSLDIRGSKAWSAGTAALGGKIDAGKPQQGGYRKELSSQVEARTKYAATLTGRGLTGEEKKTIAQADANKTNAQTQQKTAEEQKDFAENELHDTALETSARKQEVSKLEQDKKELETSHETLAAAHAGVLRADKNLKEAAVEKEQADKEVKEAETNSAAAGAQQQMAFDQKAAAQIEHDQIAQEVSKQEAEVARLEQAKSQEEKFSPNGKMTEETEQNLKTAQENLAASQAELTAADAKLEQANKDLDSRTKEKEQRESEGKEVEAKSAVAQAKYSAAQERHDSATNERDIAALDTSAKETKLGKLEEVTGKLTTAQQNLTTSEAALKDAETKLKEADKNLNAKAKAKEEAEKAEVKTKTDIGMDYDKENNKWTVGAKSAQQKYAKNLEFGIDPKSKWSLLNPAANTEAAKKIRKEAGKSQSDKQLDDLRKLIAKATEEKPREIADAVRTSGTSATTPKP